MNIYIIRHGQTELNRLGIVQGSGVDSSLNDKGRQQAQAFYQKYKDIPFEVILTSKLQRTHQTVQPFLEKELPWEQFAEINEICWGEQEGKKANLEMRRRYDEIVQEWTKGNFGVKLKDAESIVELAERLQSFIDHLKERNEKNILVCSHGRSMRALMCLLNEIPLTQMQTFKHNNTGLYQFYFNGERFEMKLENDLSHLV